MLMLVLTVLLLLLDMQLFECMLEVLGKGHFIGQLLLHLLPANRQAAGGQDQGVVLGHGQVEVPKNM